MSIVELAGLHSMSQPFISKWLKPVKRKPFVEKIDRHALRKTVNVPDAKRQGQPKQELSDRLAL